MENSRIIVYALIGIVLFAALLYLLNHGRSSFRKAWKEHKDAKPDDKDHQARWTPFVSYTLLCLLAGLAVYFFTTEVVFTKANETTHALVRQHKADLEKIDSMERSLTDLQADLKRLKDEKASMNAELAAAKKDLEAKNVDRSAPPPQTVAAKPSSAPAPKRPRHRPAIAVTSFSRARPGGFEQDGAPPVRKVAISHACRSRARPGGFQ